MSDQLTLFIGNKNYSSWSLRPWFFMRMADLEFEEVLILLDQANTQEEIRKYSPTGRVPILLHNKTYVWESLAICEYVAEIFDLDDWPADPPARAHARSASHEMHAGFHAMREEFPMNCRARRRIASPSAAAMADIQRIGELWSECRGRFGRAGPWLYGSFCIADAMFAPVVMRARSYAWELPVAAAEYAQNLTAHPVMTQWLRAAEAETASIPHEDVGDPA